MLILDCADTLVHDIGYCIFDCADILDAYDVDFFTDTLCKSLRLVKQILIQRITDNNIECVSAIFVQTVKYNYKQWHLV